MPAMEETPSKRVVSIFFCLASSMTIIIPSIPAMPETIAGVSILLPAAWMIKSVVKTDAIKLSVARPAF
ncbi:hypothetical protein NCCP133_17310 [Cytobacillus sp. NCCP-133]|nr:hypothetical protein NCCP133_17310 [Cytobacillus sp. NCCP-133]